jgi:hypothetical protein
MAEEISLHSQIGRDEKGQYCAGCNHRYGYAAQRGLNLQACEHVATQLTAAGFGLVADAKREALEEAADWIHPETMDKPDYLVGVTEDFQGGNDDDLVSWAFSAGTDWQRWRNAGVIRARAAAVRGEG